MSGLTCVVGGPRRRPFSFPTLSRHSWLCCELGPVGPVLGELALPVGLLVLDKAWLGAHGSLLVLREVRAAGAEPWSLDFCPRATRAGVCREPWRGCLAGGPPG